MGIKGTLAIFQPRTARYMLSGVLPTREGPIRTASAFAHPSGRRPSS